MIFEKSILRELRLSAIAIFTVLLFILLTSQLIQFLGQAAEGKITAASILLLLAYAALNYLAIVLSITLFISVMVTLSRMYSDSEMVVWFSSGLSLLSLLKPVGKFTLPFIISIAVLSLYLSPWAIQKMRVLRSEIEQDKVSLISAGKFQEASDTDRVYFVESIQTKQFNIKNIFISDQKNGKSTVVTASDGHIESAQDGGRYLILENGQRYEPSATNTGYRVVEFMRYALLLDNLEQREASLTAKSISFNKLLQDPTPEYNGELVWRIGLPVSALILTFLAVSLSFVNQRSGRSSHLLLALFAYITYNNMISLMQSWTAQGQFSIWFGLLSLHLLMFLFALLFFIYRFRFPQPIFSWR